jgi:HD-like signal output (HDOD) protein
MSSKILQLANSSFFGTGRRITSLPDAIALLGLDLVKGLALTANVFAASDKTTIKGFSFEKLRGASVMAAQLAKLIHPEAKTVEDAFTAALVHEVGEIVLALGAPDELERAVGDAAATKRPLFAVEHDQLGTNHAAIGAYLLGTWGLPFPIVEAVAYHHAPRTFTEAIPLLVTIVHAADALVDEALGHGESELDVDAITRAGFADRLPQWRKLADKLASKGVPS